MSGLELAAPCLFMPLDLVLPCEALAFRGTQPLLQGAGVEQCGLCGRGHISRQDRRQVQDLSPDGVCGGFGSLAAGDMGQAAMPCPVRLAVC